MKRFCVNRTRLAVGVVAVTGLGLASGGVATAVTTQTSSRSLASTLAALVAKHNIPMPVAGKQGITLVKVNPNGTLDPSATSPAHCHFAPSTKSSAKAGTISDAHPSTSVPGAIKVNSYIVCDHAVRALSNKTQLWKTGFLFNHLQGQTTTKNTGKAVLPNLGTYRRCTNKKSTTWYGVAYGISEEGGQLYYGYGASPHNATFDCGT
jgi:hypothetical protein